MRKRGKSRMGPKTSGKRERNNNPQRERNCFPKAKHLIKSPRSVTWNLKKQQKSSPTQVRSADLFSRASSCFTSWVLHEERLKKYIFGYHFEASLERRKYSYSTKLPRKFSLTQRYFWDFWNRYFVFIYKPPRPISNGRHVGFKIIILTVSKSRNV